jgi:hypothetical protein
VSVKRRLLSAGALVSLVLCILSGVAWWRSHTRAYGLRFTGQPDSAIELVHGGIEAWHGRVSYGGPRAWQRSEHPLAVYFLNFAAKEHPRMSASWGSAYRERWGFGWGRGGAYVWLLRVPLWTPMGVFGLLAASCFLMARKSNRAGCCPACGYDLRGTPGNNCPECGVERVA